MIVKIAKSIYAGKKKIVYPELPQFTPEIFMRVTAKNVMKQKSFHKGNKNSGSPSLSLTNKLRDDDILGSSWSGLIQRATRFPNVWLLWYYLKSKLLRIDY